MRHGPLCFVLFLATATSTPGQFNERPGLPGSGDPAVDISGRSIKNMRVRAVHTEDPRLEGGTAYFFEYDPFLAYQLGRNLNFREFRTRDGIFDASISGLGGPMPDGTTAKITTNNQTSCIGCHNLPQGSPGGGPNFHKDSGFGRNSPHYFGAGIIEMLALQIRADMLDQLDQNDDGWVSAREAERHGGRVEVRTHKNGPWIDYGNPQLSNSSTGTPSLNNIFNVWYVDRAGKVVEGATEVDGKVTFGYNFAMIVWGWGQGPGRAALNPTNRAFLWDPWKAHGGLEAYDPSTSQDPDGDGVSESTLAGAIQFPVSHLAPDGGKHTDRRGFSRDDPDGDGYLNEISEGDLDLAEWFMLNAPRPAFAGTREQFRHGVQLLTDMGCAECHSPRWDIRPKGDTYAGDRRFFDLNVRWNQSARRLEGRLIPLHDDGPMNSYHRRFNGFEVVGLFTDLRHHDMGREFTEVDFGGTRNALWRTPPLWGVGSSFPYGHDGQSLTIEDAIARHGGEAADSRRQWHHSSQRDRRALLKFLSKLVLYDIESLPADVDGDGRVSSHFEVAGLDTGYERFNAEWLFRNPAEIQGPFVNIDGDTINSCAVTNVDEAYGQSLRLRVDSDADGWPDVWDHAPRRTGYKDGVR